MLPVKQFGACTVFGVNVSDSGGVPTIEYTIFQNLMTHYDNQTAPSI